jgi:uncharacterized repeat protein (TIGR03803 family)
VQGTNDLLYGVTAGGGTYGKGTLFRLDTNGVSFEVAPFRRGGDGQEP